MNHQQDHRHTGLKQLSELYDSITTRIHEELAPLVELIEARSPGHRFGRRVVLHMEELPKQISEIDPRDFLSPDQILLLKFCLGIHDIGRIICEADRPSDRSHQHHHGIIGAEFLRSHNLLEDLPQEQKQISLDVVEQHSLKEVTLPRGSLAFNICFLLRDLDKLDILSRYEEFLSPAGALKQMSLWMAPDSITSQLALLDEAETAELYRFIEPILSGDHLPMLCDAPHIQRELFSLLTLPISQEILTKVEKGSLLSREEMLTGYPAYMLGQCALANELQTYTAKAHVRENELLLYRANFLALVQPQTKTAISSISMKVGDKPI